MKHFHFGLPARVTVLVCVCARVSVLRTQPKSGERLPDLYRTD